MKLLMTDKKTNQVIEKNIPFSLHEIWYEIEMILKEEMKRDIMFYKVKEDDGWCEFDKNISFDIEIKLTHKNKGE